MVIRGVTFQGIAIDDWEPIGPLTADQLNSFSLDRGDLTDFILAFEMPIRFSQPQGEIEAKLHIKLELGKPNRDDTESREDLQLALIVGEQSYRSKIYGWFEDALSDIQAQLPKGEYIKICFKVFRDFLNLR